MKGFKIGAEISGKKVVGFKIGADNIAADLGFKIGTEIGGEKVVVRFL